MPYLITEHCIGCHRCPPVCPTGAIQETNSRFWIDTQRCTRCVGSYGTPQCVAVCPTNGACIPDVEEFWGHWFEKYNRLISRLQHTEQAAYWEQWFDRYSQKITKHLSSSIASPIASPTPKQS